MKKSHCAASILPLACGCRTGVLDVLLPMLSRPPVVAYNYCAFVLGAWLGKRPDDVAFLFTNYIGLESPASYSDRHLLSFTPAIGINHAAEFGIGRSEDAKVAVPGEAIAQMLDRLRQGWYVRFNGDEFYIPQTPNFGRRHFVHDNLAYGYCSDCNRVSIAGYRGEGTTIDFSSSAIDLVALSDSLAQRGFCSDPFQGIMCYYRPTEERREPDLISIRSSIERYLSSGVSGTVSSGERATGIGIYCGLKRHLSTVALGAGKVDLRAFRLLWEHKKIMVSRISKLQPHFAVTEKERSGLIELEVRCLEIFLALVDSQRRGRPIPGNWKEQLDEARDIERYLLERVLHSVVLI